MSPPEQPPPDAPAHSGADRLLDEGLRSLGRWDPAAAALLRRRPDTRRLLNTYIEEIERFNPAYGLVAVKNREELVIRHILDSLAPLGIIARLLGEQPAGNNAHSFTIADAGSGAGLPGIPLAIVLREASFTLIERTGRRAGFLRGALAVLGLSAVTVKEEELEQTARDPAAAGSFDLVVFRAFRPLEGPILRGLLALLRPGGVLAAYKGRKDRVTAEMAAAEKSGAGPWEAVPLRVPFLDEERHLALLRPPHPCR
ncbi:MAG: 16S rRNA (guanine(527)-N(7))-methyltransferase RsmG [Treponema sp.]|jgi:16S rRNA (guanine527-N7)-methyltransferase|nr:16S rRNA (guanine(527)-N(7))-methyltransferase RsmG [Treponema sp.]